MDSGENKKVPEGGVHAREGHKEGFTVWFTGLSASGKSTISNALAAIIREKIPGPLYVIDGDYMRRTINRDLGFTQSDRNIATERIAYVAKILNQNGVVCIVSNISQDENIRARVREIIGNFHLVFVNTPLKECMLRDYKGNYEKALSGEMTDMVGVDAAYEEPVNPEMTIDTCTTGPEEAAELIARYLDEHLRAL